MIRYNEAKINNKVKMAVKIGVLFPMLSSIFIPIHNPRSIAASIWKASPEYFAY
jgi:hypothetical protein